MLFLPPNQQRQSTEGKLHKAFTSNPEKSLACCFCTLLYSFVPSVLTLFVGH